MVMQRTKALGLLHKQICKDSAMSRQGIPDYLVTMRKPGINETPISGEFDHYAGEDAEEVGKGRFSIEYQLSHTKPRKKGIGNLFGLLGSGEPSSISIQSERESSGEFSIEYLALDVKNLQKGDYELNISVRDELSGKTIYRQTNLTLY